MQSNHLRQRPHNLTTQRPGTRSAFLNNLPLGFRRTAVDWFQRAAQDADGQAGLVLFHLRGICRRTLSDRTAALQFHAAAKELLAALDADRGRGQALAMAADVLDAQQQEVTA